MFGLQYMTKVYEIKWLIPKDKVEELEDLLFVKFKFENDYHMIETVAYTVMDIIAGMEEINFNVRKRGSEIVVEILL